MQITAGRVVRSAPRRTKRRNVQLTLPGRDRSRCREFVPFARITTSFTLPANHLIWPGNKQRSPMKVAIVYNRESKSVINLFGSCRIARDDRAMKTIQRLVERAQGRGVTRSSRSKATRTWSIAWKSSCPASWSRANVPEWSSTCRTGFRDRRDTRTSPAILEMVGRPLRRVGTARSLAGPGQGRHENDPPRSTTCSTPDFAVLESSPTSPVPELSLPGLIVKPKNEAVSFGLKVVQNADAAARGCRRHLREASARRSWRSSTSSGREVNVGLLGNDPPGGLAPRWSSVFGTEGPADLHLRGQNPPLRA